MKLSAVLYHQSNPDQPIYIDDLSNFSADKGLSLPLLLSAYLGRVDSYAGYFTPENGVEPPSALRIYDRLTHETIEFENRSELVPFCEDRGLSLYSMACWIMGRRKNFLFYERLPESLPDPWD